MFPFSLIEKLLYFLGRSERNSVEFVMLIALILRHDDSVLTYSDEFTVAELLPLANLMF